MPYWLPPAAMASWMRPVLWGLMMQARMCAVALLISTAGGAPVIGGAAHEAVRDDGFQCGGHLQANLFLLGRREDGDDTLNRFRGVESVQGRENHVAGFGGEERGGNGFEVAHFADQNDVGVLTKGGAQGGGEVR